MRADAFPEQGPPGSDLELMRRSISTPTASRYGMLIRCSRGGMEERNLDFAAALSQRSTIGRLEAWVQAGAAAARRHRGAAGGRGLRGRGDRARAPTTRPSCRSCSRRARASRSATAATGRSTRRPSAPACRSACTCRASAAAMPRPARAGRPTTCRSTTRCAATCRARVTSLVFEGVFERFPEAEGGADRGRLRLGAGAVLAHGQALGAHAQGDAAAQAPAVGICARAFLVHHPADGGAGESAASRRDHATGSAGTG